MNKDINKNRGANYSNRWAKPNKPLSNANIREKTKEQGAKLSQSTFSTKFHGWHTHHRKMFIDSLARLLKTPIASAITLLVIAISIALPAGLYIFLSNAQLISTKWDGTASISLYLRNETTQNNIKSLIIELNKNPNIASTEYISKEDALKEFKEYSGFGDALNYISGNPLPAVVLVKPKYMELERQTQLLQALQKLPEVEQASLDLAWVKRLYYIMQIGQRLVVVLSLFLGLAVLLIVGNTIRLAIDNRKQEIVVIKLVGATNAFVRRPFLYTGFWYGLGGGILAWLLLFMAVLWLKQPVAFLATSYASDFTLNGLSFNFSILLIFVSVVLGWAGAWLAVGKHIKQIELMR